MRHPPSGLGLSDFCNCPGLAVCLLGAPRQLLVPCCLWTIACVRSARRRRWECCSGVRFQSLEPIFTSTSSYDLFSAALKVMPCCARCSANLALFCSLGVVVLIALIISFCHLLPLRSMFGRGARTSPQYCREPSELGRLQTARPSDDVTSRSYLSIFGRHNHHQQ